MTRDRRFRFDDGADGHCPQGRGRQNGWTSRSRITWVALRGGAAWAPSHNGRTGPMRKNLRFVGLDVHKDSICRRRGGEWAGACAVVGDDPSR